MSKGLFNYYKQHTFEYGFNTAFCDRDNDIAVSIKKKKNTLDGIYFNDEYDYYVCADYYGSYGEFSDDDKKFLAVLGFVPSDFEQGGDNE